MPKRNNMKKNILYSLLTIAVLITTGCESLDTTQFDQNVTGNNDGQLDSKYVLLPALKLDNGQLADVVIGQPDMTSGAGVGPSGTELGPYSNASVLNGKLFLQSYLINRILVFNQIPKVSGADADYVIGQPDFLSTGNGNDNTDLYGPLGISITPSDYASRYSSRLVVAELANHRVSIFNAVPTSSGAASDVVVGQSDFNVPPITTCTDVNLQNPYDVTTTSDGKMIIADTGHNRILIYNSIPTENGAAADIVLGQNDFTSSCAPVMAPGGLFMPSGLWSDGRRLVVVDTGHNRVLIWNKFPTNNGAAADVVLGQSTFMNFAPNDDDQDGGADLEPSARTLQFPFMGVFSNGQQLFIADSGNNRVLVWNKFPTQNFQEADRVLGQNDFTSFGGGLTAFSFNFPTGITQYKKDMIISDTNNDRHLIFSGN